MAASYPIHQCDLLGSYMYSEPSKEDASCTAMLTVGETAVLDVRTELPHMQQSWHFWKVLIYCPGTTWLCIMF